MRVGLKKARRARKTSARSAGRRLLPSPRFFCFMKRVCAKICADALYSFTGFCGAPDRSHTGGGKPRAQKFCPRAVKILQTPFLKIKCAKHLSLRCRYAPFSPASFRFSTCGHTFSSSLSASFILPLFRKSGLSPEQSQAPAAINASAI